MICPAYAGMILQRLQAKKLRLICPAYAGMIPFEQAEKNGDQHLSRVCGDDPHFVIKVIPHSAFVPRMRG